MPSETPNIDRCIADGLRLASGLIRVLNNGVGRMVLSAGDLVVTPTQRVQATVDALLAGPGTYEDCGSIEGILETVTIHGGDGFHIYDPVTNRKTECHVPPDKLKIASMSLGRKVSVSGLIQFKNHEPKSVVVEEFEVFPPREKLPQFSDITGIDLIDGDDSVAHVRSQSEDG